MTSLRESPVRRQRPGRPTWLVALLVVLFALTLVAEFAMPGIVALIAPGFAGDPVRTPLDTGVRAINALLTVGRGQRLGLFAGTGVGKTYAMLDEAMK